MGLSPALLCLGFVVFIASAFPHEGQDRLEGDQQALKGADLEKYRSRLQKLGKNAQQQIGENKIQLQVNSHSENDTSIISINNKEGLLEYL
uniref:Promotilin n=1 Tax=Heterorhabditis bacteriophora TaxID=37862 RepID=A0A1I7XA81_HETBA